MLITIGEKTRENMNVLGIKDYPFTETELKSCFRALIKEEHSDISSDKNSKEKSQKIISAYNELKNLATIEKKINGDHVVVKRDVEDLFDFSQPCSSCQGMGYHIQHQHKHCSCDISRSWSPYSFMVSTHRTGYKTLKCFPCNGTGKFKLKSGREVECLKCKGEGKFRVKCKFCKGMGYLLEEIKVECGTCEGTGRVELKVYNPVIPKGAILR